MGKKKIAIIVLIIILLVGLGIATKFFFLDHQDKSVSALRVDSVPNADLYINDAISGKTPYLNEAMAPGEYKIKLIPAGITGTFFPWETKIKLTKNSLTYVSRDIGSSDDSSGHQIVWLEKGPVEPGVSLAIISDPDGASVAIDGAERGTLPAVIKNVTVGNHEISVSQEGFSDQIIKARIIEGYRVNVIVKLARNATLETAKEMPTSLASASAIIAATNSSQIKTQPSKPYLVIKETGTGFLRVRVEPALGATEADKVKPGEKYTIVAELNGWTKIQISTSSGWVYDQYVQKFK